MSVYNNAIASIQIGIEDFESDDERRLLSAVRNVYAGVLLLGKAVLLHISPPEIGDVLIRERIGPKRNPDGSISFVGKFKKTIDREDIVGRLKELGIEIDGKRLSRIADVRNEIEHHFPSKPAGVVKEAIADSFMIIRDLLAVHLNQEPVAALGAKCWGVLLENHDVIEKEQQACKKTLGAINWGSQSLADAIDDFRCPDCGSSLIKQVDSENDEKVCADFVCSACGEQISAELLIGDAIGKHFEWEYYVAMTDGGDPPVTTCPSCEADAYILAEGKCACCDFSIGDAECAVCGNPLSVDDYAHCGNLCSYHAWVASKEADRD